MHETRRANRDDLPALNAVIQRAIATWSISDRLKRLALPSYQYDEDELAYLEIRVTGDPIIALMALEAPVREPAAHRREEALLHGLFVDPAHQHKGLGSQLLAKAEELSRALHAPALIVKAQSDALGFFKQHGYQPTDRIDYPHAVIKALD